MSNAIFHLCAFILLVYTCMFAGLPWYTSTAAGLCTGYVVANSWHFESYRREYHERMIGLDNMLASSKRLRDEAFAELRAVGRESHECSHCGRRVLRP